MGAAVARSTSDMSQCVGQQGVSSLVFMSCDSIIEIAACRSKLIAKARTGGAFTYKAMHSYIN